MFLREGGGSPQIQALGTRLRRTFSIYDLSGHRNDSVREVGWGEGEGLAERAPLPLDPSILHRRTCSLHRVSGPSQGMDSRRGRTCSPIGVGNDGWGDGLE